MLPLLGAWIQAEVQSALEPICIIILRHAHLTYAILLVSDLIIIELIDYLAGKFFIFEYTVVSLFAAKHLL